MKPTKNKVYCRDCQKTKMLFESEKKAQNFIKFNKDEIEAESGYSPQRIYFCLFCIGWHTTSNKNSIGISYKEKMLQQFELEKIEQKEKQKIANTEKNNERNEKLKLEKSNLTNEIENLIKEFELLQKQKFIIESIFITTEEIKKLKTSKIISDKENLKKKRLLLEVLNILNKKYKVKNENISKHKKDEWKAWIENTMKTSKKFKMKEFIKYDSIKNDFQHSWEIPYDILLNTIEWRKYREGIIYRDNKTCTKCNKIQSEKIGTSYIRKLNDEELKELIKIEPIDVLGDGSILWKSKPAEVIGTIEDNPIILHVHHSYYIYGRLPWEYKTESLITVCHKCHFEIHKNELIPVYTDETFNTRVNLTPCKRCCGTGFLEQFIYYQNGICFQCDGRKFEEYN